MALQELVSDYELSPEPDPIVRQVLRCQQSFAAWAEARDEIVDVVAEQYHRDVEQLWPLIAADLMLVARGWLRSHMASNVESLALNMFAHVVLSLPRLQIDPTRNVRKLLVTIARRGLIDDYRSSHGTSPRRSRHAEDLAPEAGAPAGRMWYAAGTGHDGWAADARSGLADPESYGAEERMAAQIDEQAILAAIWAYWPTHLPAEEWQIVQLRWAADPPLSFRDIAAELGPGWTEDAVRQRHHRILKATRAYLREQGLLDDPANPPPPR